MEKYPNTRSSVCQTLWLAKYSGYLSQDQRCREIHHSYTHLVASVVDIKMLKTTSCFSWKMSWDKRPRLSFLQWKSCLEKLQISCLLEYIGCLTPWGKQPTRGAGGYTNRPEHWLAWVTSHQASEVAGIWSWNINKFTQVGRSHLRECDFFRAADKILLDFSPTAPSGSGECKVLVPVCPGLQGSLDCRIFNFTALTTWSHIRFRE